MPAYNAEKTVVKTYDEVVSQEIVDAVVIVDDASDDKTVEVIKKLKHDKVKTVINIHENNLGYGGNQKTCYRLALHEGGDIIIMVHPDYQYTPMLIPAMAGMIVNHLYDCVMASRVIGGGALKGGMPFWKYIANRSLTFVGNFLLGASLSEYHTGYRAFSRDLLKALPLERNSNGFIFDNEIIAQILWKNATIGEISCPTKYFPEASVINFRYSVIYGFGCLRVAIAYRLAKLGVIKSQLFT
jgi:glycosyltransferase involved in cell wall biosynthesis